MIGIRQADGSFYQIMGDSQSGRKRLVLSAARTDQHGVKIELYRSLSGSVEGADALGSLSLDDPEGLGYKDIEFRVDVDAQGLLEASAALPGQAPRTLRVDLGPFRGPRSDADLLNDEDLSAVDLDTLDAEFGSEPEPMTLDLPEADLPPLEEGPAHRSDSEILEDDTLADVELDELGDFNLEPEAEEAAEPAAAAPDSFELPPLGDEPFEGPPGDFDLGDLDAGFGADEPAAPPPSDALEGQADGEDWEKISLDDMESIEFMDTGAEISPRSPTGGRPSTDHEDFSLDDHSPLELGDLDSDLSDLPDLGDSSSVDDLDQDFLAPPGLTETAEWEVEEPAVAKPSKAAPAPKAAKEPRPSKTVRPSRSTAPSEFGGGLDKTALFLSLATLSLLVLLILVLLFLNMIKAPQAPVVQPEVMRWKPVASLPAASHPAEVAEIDLGSPEAPAFAASSVLEVPEALRSVRISLRLGPGDTAADAERRFGPPARSQGNLLLW